MDRYEEALERAKKGLPIDEVFPELKESEDERIRKELLEEIEFIIPHDDETDSEGLILPSYHARIDRYKSYLEKQKEQKHPDGCFTCDEYKKGYEEGRRNGFTAGYNKAMKEVEQKEQKPVVTHGETYHVDTLGTQQVIAGKMPQKPAEWSEEDEEMLKSILFVLESYVSHSESASSPSLITSYPIYYKEIDWLKSLRPSWKPSEEQMEILKDAFRKDGGNEYRKIINSLYCDLQKLL